MKLNESDIKKIIDEMDNNNDIFKIGDDLDQNS
jgi:hypothetical protein